ncbi:Uncharacterised protein [Mycobacteroides abscessus subsp. abscessus]|nr:Uncharacterised protein [Mycobacteroides abscessus subsp. abscessus]
MRGARGWRYSMSRIMVSMKSRFSSTTITSSRRPAAVSVMKRSRISRSSG